MNARIIRAIFFAALLVVGISAFPGDDASLSKTGLIGATDETISGTLGVTGAVTLSSTLTVTGTTALGVLTTSSTATFGGDVTLDDNAGASPSLVLQDATNETATFSKVDAGYMTITTVAGDGVSVRTGNLTVGNGTAGTAAMDGEDAYVEGDFEVDGTVTLDGALTAGGAAGATLSIGSDDTVADTITVGSAKDTTSVAGIAVTVGSTGTTSALTLQSGTGDVNITSTDDLNVGANASAQDVVVGNQTGASSLKLYAGTGNITMDGVAATTITIGDAAQTGTVKLGESSATMALDIGTGTGAHTISIGNGAGAQAVTMGSTNTTAATTVQSGTGDVTITSTDDFIWTATDDISISSNSAAGIIGIGDGNDGYAINIGADNSAADTIVIGSALDTSSLAGISVTVGSTGTTSATTVQSGTGDLALTSTDDITLTVNTAVTDNITLTATQSTQATAISLSAPAGTVKIAGDLLDVDTTGDMDITVTSSGAGEDLLLTQSGANDSSITLTAAGTGTDAIGLVAAAGAISLSSADVTIDSSDDTTIIAADDLTLNGNSAGSVINLGTNNDGNAINIGTDNSSADTIIIGSALDSVTLTGTVAVTTPTAFEYKLATVTGVDVNAAANTTLYTVPAGKNAIITKIVIRGASGTFDQAQDPQLSFGWDANATDVIANATYTKPSAATTYLVIPADGKTSSSESTRGQAAETFDVKVNVTATAVTTCTIDVFGYLY